ncbi:MAG: glycosyltransferase family 4 protein, partial [Candidatus Sulfotelmatobacter sp.]
ISRAQRAPLPWINWQGTVYHGLPADSLEPCGDRGEYLAFLGRISPEKGVDQAIEIAKQAGVPLKIAAKIDRADQMYFDTCIRHLMDDSLIDFVGEISDQEKNEFLGNATALLFPINWAEPFGIVLIEAMACGVPVIAYPAGSVPEIIENGVNGFLVHDVQKAVTTVEQISTIDRDVCRQQFEERFTAKRMAREYVAIYERIVKGMAKPIALRDGDLNWTELESPSSTT